MPDEDLTAEPAQPDLPPSEAELPTEAEPLPTDAIPEPAAPDLLEPVAGAVAATNEPQPYDFRGPSLLTTAELRKARLRHEDYARSLATRLSIYLRLEVGVAVSALQTMTYRRFIDSLASPNNLTLFRLEPLNGIGLVAIPPRLDRTVVDRLLGGAGNAGTLDQPLTEIEVAMLNLVVQLILREWCQGVAHLDEARPQILGYESTPRFVQIASNDTPMLVLSIEGRIGDCAEPMQLAFPFHMVEALVRPSDPITPPQKQEPAGSPTRLPHWNPALAEVKVAVKAEWNGLPVTADALARLKVGDVLPVAPQHFNHVRVRLAKVCKFIGRLGTANNLRAIELTEVVAHPLNR
jgi:flagellar motor switch protein FliM